MQLIFSQKEAIKNQLLNQVIHFLIRHNAVSGPQQLQSAITLAIAVLRLNSFAGIRIALQTNGQVITAMARRSQK